MASELDNLLKLIDENKWRLQPYIEDACIIHKAIWGAKILDNVAKAIKQGDPVAIDIGCLIISEDQKYPFGKIIKSNLARALRKEAKQISKIQRKKVLHTMIKLLNMKFTPCETEDYCKLISKFPASEILDCLKFISPQTAAGEKWVLYLEHAANRVRAGV